MPRHSVHYAVFGIITNEEGKVLFLERKNTQHYAEYFDLPAGHGESEESMYEALSRELFEEIGITMEAAEMLHLTHYISKKNETDYLYIFFNITKYSGTPTILEPEKCSKLSWIDPNQLPSNTVPCTKASLKAMQKGKSSSIFTA